METLTTEKAVTRWDEILERVERGETLAISRGGEAVVRLVRYEEAITSEQGKEPA
jgi:antitoxin (DNA-binding transcriptional repressor) of toxin-antitoxin stability system